MLPPEVPLRVRLGAHRRKIGYKGGTGAGFKPAGGTAAGLARHETARRQFGD